jgi:glucose-1-phosphate thymidylyltransferase
MKGVVLAGGTGSRLSPLTKVTNKHLLPVSRYPMIYFPIYRLVQAGITEILIVTGTEHMGAIVNLLGSGKEYGARFTYKVQDEAGGIAQALGLAENFAGQDSLAVILGDNIFKDSILSYAENFKKQGKGSKVLIKEVEDPTRYGVPTLKDGKILKITEKPQKPESHYCVTGIYFYDNRVFEIIRTLRPSQRKEFEITDVNNAYVREGSMSYDILEGWWTDAGTHGSLTEAGRLGEEIEIDFSRFVAGRS